MSLWRSLRAVAAACSGASSGDGPGTPSSSSGPSGTSAGGAVVRGSLLSLRSRNNSYRSSGRTILPADLSLLLLDILIAPCLLTMPLALKCANAALTQAHRRELKSLADSPLARSGILTGNSGTGPSGASSAGFLLGGRFGVGIAPGSSSGSGSGSSSGVKEAGG